MTTYVSKIKIKHLLKPINIYYTKKTWKINITNNKKCITKLSEPN